MRKLTIDSSVIISSLLENEPRHAEALRIWEAVIAGQGRRHYALFRICRGRGGDQAQNEL